MLLISRDMGSNPKTESFSFDVNLSFTFMRSDYIQKREGKCASAFANVSRIFRIYPDSITGKVTSDFNRMIFWKKEHGEFFKVSVQSMINRTLSWDRTPGREDVLLAINLLLEFAKKDPKMFKYWNC